MEKIPTNSLFTKIGKQQLKKMHIKPLPGILDVNLTRVYFTSSRDICSRVLILVIHIFWIGLIFFNEIELGKIVANSPAIRPIHVVKMISLQVITMIITIIFTFFILIMILPIFLAKTIKGITLTCIVYLILGTIINLIIMIISFFNFFDGDSPYRLTVVILAISSIIFWWISIINWWFSIKKRKKMLIQSIIKMYELGYK